LCASHPAERSLAPSAHAAESRSKLTQSRILLLNNGEEREHKVQRREATLQASTASVLPRCSEANVWFTLREVYTWLTQYDSAATNAANSPLLRLPPEIRCRIYDYAFGGFLVHVDCHGRQRKQVLRQKICNCPQQCASLPFQQCVSRILPGSPYIVWCKSSKDVPENERRKIPVHILQVCRQIYHEAVLKTFTQATFHLTATKRGSPGVNVFLDNLCPEQVRSIAHLCVTSRDASFMSRPITSRFKGLRHLEVHIITFLREHHLAQEPGIKELKNLGLKSLRFTTKSQPDNEKASVLEWIRLQEIEILSKQQPMLTAD
jgi:hypothetical protein